MSPSPTTYRPFRDKSRSPSQNSQQSFDSSSPPTPQCQKRHRQGPVVVSEATIVGVRKTGQIWPSDGDSLSGKLSQDGAFHADAGKCLCQPGGDTGEVGGAGAGRYFVEWFSSASGGLEGFVPIPPAEQIPSLLSS